MSEAGLVRAVSTQLRDAVTEEQIKMVLEAVQRLRDGDPVGTVLHNAASGAVAVRVAESGVPYWHVTSLDGSLSNDTNATLAGWDVLKAVQ